MLLSGSNRTDTGRRKKISTIRCMRAKSDHATASMVSSTLPDLTISATRVDSDPVSKSPTSCSESSKIARYRVTVTSEGLEQSAHIDLFTVPHQNNAPAAEGAIRN